MHTVNSKAVVKITKHRFILNKLTEKVIWNHKNYSTNLKEDRKEEKRTKNRWDKQKINSKMVDVKSSKTINHIKCKWSKHSG